MRPDDEGGGGRSGDSRSNNKNTKIGEHMPVWYAVYRAAPRLLLRS